MTRAGWALACVLLTSACQEAPGSPEEIGAAPPPAAETHPTGEHPAAVETETDPAPEPTRLDDMDQAALEAACYEGRQAACDRLGH